MLHRGDSTATANRSTFTFVSVCVCVRAALVRANAQQLYALLYAENMCTCIHDVDNQLEKLTFIENCRTVCVFSAYARLIEVVVFIFVSFFP